MRDIVVLLSAPDGVDRLAVYTAELLSPTAAMTWRRAQLLPLAILALLLIVAQEGLVEVAGISHTAEDVMHRHHIPPEVVSIVALVVIVWQTVRVYQRSMRRAYLTGLQDA